MENLKSESRGLFSDADGRLVEVLKAEGGKVYFAPQGGGFILHVPEERFRSDFKAAALPAWHAVEVEAEWLPEGQRFAAFSNGQRWNGWAVPYFELETGMRLCSLVPNLVYDKERDAFVWHDPDGPEDEQAVFEAASIDVEGTVHKVYGIGAMYWTWDLSQ